jgi:antirestriction protein ArdC
MAPTTTPAFAELLQRAVNEPGIISEAYSRFHDYSIGNLLLALFQCKARGIRPGPIATYQRWRELGRQVQRGQRAIVLCQPVTVKRKVEGQNGTETDEEIITRFVYRPHWFVLAQTEGKDLDPQPIPSWDRAKALVALNVQEISFDLTDGNCLGFARGRSIAISPLNPFPHKTTFHELGHVLLDHTTEGDQNETEFTSRNLREAEAEAVALICCEALGLDGAAQCRGYLQSWWGKGNPIPERSAQKILKVADQILKAGTAGAEDANHG